MSTGVALFYAPQGEDKEPHVHTFVETTKVRFAELPPEVIRAYVATGEPFDKAGGYGYQSKAGAFVSSIHGDYWNVVGFPMHRFSAALDVERLKAWTRQQATSAGGEQAREDE